MTKIWIEDFSGFHSKNSDMKHFTGFAHAFIDCTNRPAPTIMAGRPIYCVLEQVPSQMKSVASYYSNKPAYHIPTMREVEVLTWNGLNVVSTFSGCGGSCLGYRMAGYRVLWANEFIPEAQATYKANHPSSYLDTRDIRTIKPEEILERIGLKAGELDLLDGSPPCASFSTAGKREKGWGQVKKYSDKAQRTDDLFFEYVRILRGLQPKVFVAENVSGLVKGTAKGYFLEILAELKASGYNVKAAVLNAAWLGVPQSRERLIFIGVRNDLRLNPVHPAPFPYQYSVREALPWITKVQHAGTGTTRSPIWKTSNLPSLTIMGSGATISPTAYLSGGSYIEAETDISCFAIGAEWERMGHPRARCSGVVHPTEKRRFSIAELRRICSFPEDFVLTGTYSQQWERMGRSVPPLMMKAISSTVRDRILGKR